MHSTASSPAITLPRVVLALLGEAPPDVLAVTAEVLARFEVGSLLLSIRMCIGQTPDLSALAEILEGGRVELIIAATREAFFAQALAASVAVPVIRVPIAKDRSPAAALAALTECPAEPSIGSFATVAVGEAGARNAALLAVSILSLTDERLRAAWIAFRDEQTRAVLAQPPPAG